MPNYTYLSYIESIFSPEQKYAHKELRKCDRILNLYVDRNSSSILNLYIDVLILTRAILGIFVLMGF
jgi:hypothetical protein